jgi:hypothetical protein
MSMDRGLTKAIYVINALVALSVLKYFLGESLLATFVFLAAGMAMFQPVFVWRGQRIWAGWQALGLAPLVAVGFLAGVRYLGGGARLGGPALILTGLAAVVLVSALAASYFYMNRTKSK